MLVFFLFAFFLQLQHVELYAVHFCMTTHCQTDDEVFLICWCFLQMQCIELSQPPIHINLEIFENSIFISKHSPFTQSFFFLKLLVHCESENLYILLITLSIWESVIRNLSFRWTKMLSQSGQRTKM